MSCGGARAPRSEGPDLLRFGVSHFQGSYGFVVHEDLQAEHWSSAGAGAADEVKVTTKATKQELDELAALLEKNDVCGLSSSRRTGVPDEARPSMSIRYGKLDCSVQMWDGEFRDDPKARACLEAIEGLGARIKKRAG